MKGTVRPPAAIVIMIAALAACGSTAFAQSGTAAELSESGAAVGRRADDGPLRAAVRREAMRLAQSSAQVPKQGESWIVRHPVIVGTLIGTGVGAGLSQVQAIGGVNHEPKVALLGAGVGAWGGLIATAVHKARTKQRVGIGTKIGIVAGAVSLIVVPVLACYGAGGCGGSS
jgi:hypothetical protein